MQLSETVKLSLSKDQKAILVRTMKEYIHTVNRLSSLAVNGTSISKYTSADVKADLPSAMKNQCIRDAKSVVNKYNKDVRKAKQLKKKKPDAVVKEPSVSVVRKLCCFVNNQNFKIDGDFIGFPVLINGETTRIYVSAAMTDRQKQIFANAKLGTLRIVFKGHKIVAQVVYEAVEPQPSDEGNVMGVDLGIKCPAVSYSSDGSVKFYGNGRKNKYMRRQFNSRRKKLQKAKHIKAVKRSKDKEQRIMKDTDHKISRAIINTAVAHHVKTIKMERLANIRSTTRRSRKNNHSLHTWSFYRLSKFIEYKAKLAGIRVEYVNPAYTSQRCPVCGHVHHARDINYTCKCGFHIHRDILGAMNICNSTEYVGG